MGKLLQPFRPFSEHASYMTVWTVQFRALPGVDDDDRRVRLFLKRALRDRGLECISIRTESPETHDQQRARPSHREQHQARKLAANKSDVSRYDVMTCNDKMSGSS